jgi:hypothetical protein
VEHIYLLRRQSALGNGAERKTLSGNYVYAMTMMIENWQ